MDGEEKHLGNKRSQCSSRWYTYENS